MPFSLFVESLRSQRPWPVRWEAVNSRLRPANESKGPHAGEQCIRMSQSDSPHHGSKRLLRVAVRP
jgi:hypothetical protein